MVTCVKFNICVTVQYLSPSLVVPVLGRKLMLFQSITDYIRRQYIVNDVVDTWHKNCTPNGQVIFLTEASESWNVLAHWATGFPFFFSCLLNSFNTLLILSFFFFSSFISKWTLSVPASLARLTTLQSVIAMPDMFTTEDSSVSIPGTGILMSCEIINMAEEMHDPLYFPMYLFNSNLRVLYNKTSCE